jgi:hypothetical protein
MNDPLLIAGFLLFAIGLMGGFAVSVIAIHMTRGSRKNADMQRVRNFVEVTQSESMR